MKLSLVFVVVLLMSCSVKTTDDPEIAYKYWAGSKAPSDLELLEGKYWESAHWSKEYILYLKIRPSRQWWSALVEQNNLELVEDDLTLPYDRPEWFDPTPNSIQFRQSNRYYDNGSRYLLDTLSGISYLYEIQL